MPNKIIQMTDANGDNIYPVGFSMGGMKVDLLWTNSSPTSSFSAQTVGIDFNGYDFLFCDYLLAASVGTGILYSALHKVYDVDEQYYEAFWHTSVANKYGRNVTVKGEKTSLVYTTGYENNSASTNALIPYHVYGIKMSYIAPTIVHDLQYVEVT